MFWTFHLFVRQLKQQNRCWLKHLGSRRTPTVPYRPWFQFSSMGRKLFAVDLQENERGIESSRRTFHYEEFIFLGQVWGGHQLCHQLCHRDYLQLQRPAQVGKPSDRIQKGQGPYVFFENTSKWREEAFRNVGQGRVYKSTTNCEGHRWRGLSAQRTAMDRPSTRTRRLRGSFVTNGNQADFAGRSGKRHGPNRAVTAPEELHQKILSGDHQQSASVDCVFCKLAVNPLRCCAYTRQIEEHAVHMCSPEERRGVCNYMKAFSPPIQELICAFCFSLKGSACKGFATTMQNWWILVIVATERKLSENFHSVNVSCKEKKGTKLMPFACSRSKITALDKFDHDLTDNPLLEWVCCLRDVSPNGRTIQSSNLLKFIVPIFIAIVCFISITFPNHISRRQSSSPKRNAKPEWSNCFFWGVLQSIIIVPRQIPIIPIQIPTVHG